MTRPITASGMKAHSKITFPYESTERVSSAYHLQTESFYIVRVQ